MKRRENYEIWDWISRISTALAVILLLLGVNTPNKTTRLIFSIFFLGIILRLGIRARLKRRRDPLGRSFADDATTQQSNSSLTGGVQISDAILDSDVTRAAQFENLFFPKEAFDSSILLRMSRKYPPGISLATDANNKVISLMGLWPISKKAYESLKEGRINELEITPADIIARSPLRFWWLGVIATDSAARKTNPFLTAHVLNYGLKKWKRDCASDVTSGLIASGFTIEGSRVASRLGMARVEGKSHDIFFIEGTSDQIEDRFKKAFPFFTRDHH